MSDQNPPSPSSSTTEDDEIAAAMALLSQDPLPTSTLPNPEPPMPGAMPSAPGEPAQPWTPPETTGSPTLDALDESRRPKAKTVCEACPNSVWFASPAEVKCYCRVMFLVTWSSKEQNQITHCDGEFLGQDEG